MVECELIDVHGVRWLFIEKGPVVSDEFVDEHTTYPRPASIACEVLERYRSSGLDVARISTLRPWDIEATGGESTFDVSAELLCEL